MTTSHADLPNTPAAASPSPLEEILARPLFQACLETNHKEVQHLLSQGANPNLSYKKIMDGNAQSFFPLQATLMALSKGDATPRMLKKQVVRIATTLFDAGARLDSIERHLLFSAVDMEVEDLLELLVAKGAKVQKRQGFELVCIAMVNQSDEMLNALVKHGVNLNVRDYHLSTPFLDWISGQVRVKRAEQKLEDADTESLLKIIEKFKLCGVDINLRDHLGATPLMRCLVTGKTKTARALVLANADMELSMINGVKAIHLASACGNQDLLRFLFERGLQVEAGDISRMANLQPDTKSLVLSHAKN